MINSQDKVAIEMKFIETGFAHSPEEPLLFDVTINNLSGQTKWVIFPGKIDFTRKKEERGGVDGLSILQKKENENRIVLGIFMGTGGFQVLNIPPEAEIHLGKFSISHWDEDIHIINTPFSIEIIIANDISIGGKPARDWFTVDPLCSAKADILCENLVILDEIMTPDNKEHPVTINKEYSYNLYFDLKKSFTGQWK